MTLPASRPERQNRRLAMQMTDVIREMAAQHAKFGPQHGLLDVDVRVDLIAAEAHRACVARDVYQIPGAARARHMVERAKAEGRNEWAAIALEEFCEAIEARPGRERRVELVQTIAVLFRWVDEIDRREIHARQSHGNRKASERKRTGSTGRSASGKRRAARAPAPRRRRQ